MAGAAIGHLAHPIRGEPTQGQNQEEASKVKGPREGQSEGRHGSA